MDYVHIATRPTYHLKYSDHIISAIFVVYRQNTLISYFWGL